jgi:hypothetical protein
MHRLNRVLIYAMPLASVLSTSCQKDTLGPDDRARSSIVFDLAALKRATVSGQQGDGISILDVLELTVEPEGDESQQFTERIQAGDSQVVFDIEVKKGSVRFAARIFSNNGTEIYAGSRTMEVTEDGFVVEIPLQPVDAVLFVAPDSIVARPRPRQTILIENKGSRDLSWQIEEIVPLDNACRISCVVFLPNSGEVPPGKSTQVQVIPGQANFGNNFRVRIGSNVGYVDIKVLLKDVARPDLVVTDLDSTGPIIVNNQGNPEAPIRAVVKNIGEASAGIFKLAAEYTSQQRTFTAAFTVPGQSNSFYPFTSSPLAPGNTVTFEGKVVFSSSLRGTTVTLRIIADSCSGDEFMPSYCRVEESNESNNVSSAISLRLP